MGGSRDVRPVHSASYFEPRLVQSPAKGKIFSGAGLSACDKFAAVIGHDGTDGKRNHAVALRIFVSADQRRNVLCPPASYGGRVLGLCADGASSGAALEHGVRKTWKGSGPLPEFPVENHCGKDCRNCTCGLWTFRIYQQRFTGLYVSSDTVRIYGFQRTGRSILPGLSGHDGIFHFCRPLSFQRNEAL